MEKETKYNIESFYEKSDRINLTALNNYSLYLRKDIAILAREINETAKLNKLNLSEQIPGKGVYRTPKSAFFINNMRNRDKNT